MTTSRLDHTDSPSASRMTYRLFTRAAAALALLAGAACDYDPEIDPQFVNSGTGSVQGRLFFDSDNNGQYNPVGGDTALKGVAVELRERGTAQVVGRTTTDVTTGMFSLPNVPVGSYELFTVASTGSTGTLRFCTNPNRVSVFNAEQTFLQVAAKRGCVVRVDVAKQAQPGEIVAVTGVVTARQGTYRTDNVYIQDVTGGVQIFNIPATAGLVEGDSVEVSGPYSTFNQEIQFGSNQVPAVVTKIASVTPIAPRTSTLTELVDAAAARPRNALIGRLVRLQKVQISTIPSGTTGSRNFGVTGSPIEIRFDGNVGSLPNSTFQAGQCYDVVGVFGLFNALGQVKPRRAQDITPVSCTLQ